MLIVNDGQWELLVEKQADDALVRGWRSSRPAGGMR
jgi:hypothetical protein